MPIPVTPSATARQLIRARTEAAMVATITILRGNLGTLNVTTGEVGGLASATTIYAGKARIRNVNGTGVINVGDGEIDQRSTVISIPIDSPVPFRDDLVRIDNDGNTDTDLDSRIFRVLDVDGGGMFGDARRMTCTSWHESRYWGEQ